MKKAIENYYQIIRETIPDYFENDRELHSKVREDIAFKMCNGYFPVKRTEKTNVSIFKARFGYELPEEIEQYINIFWHTYISGFCHSKECIILFPVLPLEGDGVNELLFYNNGIMCLAEQWSKIGDISKYIPIGWLDYTGSWVLYEIKTKNIFLEDALADKDGILEKNPIAQSLKELITKITSAITKSI